MATPPVQIAGSPFVTAWTGSGSKSAGGGATVATGALLVVRSMDEDATAGNTGTPSNSGTATVSWTARGAITTGSFCEGHIWTGSVTNGGTITISFSDPSSNNWGFVLNAFDNGNHNGVGVAPAAGTGTGSAPSITATVSANSWFGCINGDWTAAAHGTRTYRTGMGTATEVGFANVDGNYTTESWEHRDTGSGGSQAFGMTVPSSQTWTLIGVEVLGTTSTAASLLVPSFTSTSSLYSR